MIEKKDTEIDITNYAPWVKEFGLVEPYGKCQCGCGNDVPVSTKSRNTRGIRKGDPQRYILGHIGSLSAYDSPVDALFSNVDVGMDDECWLWKGTPRGNGYGCVRHEGRMLNSHRLSYEIHKGFIPDGMLVCHTCDNRMCVNPNHLFLGSYEDNYRDAKRKDRHTRGERSGNRKLSDSDALAIREAYRDKDLRTASRLSKQYGICVSTIRRIGKGEAWKHLKTD